MKTNFPDEQYLNELVRQLEEKAKGWQGPLDKLVMLSGVQLNWIADFMTDPNVVWSKEELPIEKLTLTGTNPEWNAIVIDKCKRSPKLLQEFFATNPPELALFADTKFVEVPILVRAEGEELRVLDGMNRAIAAIRDGKTAIVAYVARVNGAPRPYCEPHTVYDLLRAYQRKMNTDKAGLVSALKFLRKSYANVDELLRNRFNKAWLPNEEVQSAIQEALLD